MTPGGVATLDDPQGAEQVKKCTLLAQPWQSGGEELTLTEKLRRKPVSVKCESEIEELYVDAKAS